MQFELPELPYALDALEPVISRRTMEFHYGKHLQTYLNNVNSLIKETPFEELELESIMRQSNGTIFNNAAQAWNHVFYFYSFRTPSEDNRPVGAIAEAIETRWGSFENFRKEFVSAGGAIFGSGWVWLVKNQTGDLEIVPESNAGNPLLKGNTPLLTFDVWEHAYYLDFQNRRVDQLQALFQIVDWDIVDARYL